jgi:hypothetical protein
MSGETAPLIALFRARLRVFIGVFADLLLLSAWLVLNFLFSLLTHRIGTASDEAWRIARGLFGALTLSCLLIMMYFDVRSVYLQRNSEFKAEKERLDSQAESRTPPIATNEVVSGDVVTD